MRNSLPFSAGCALALFVGPVAAGAERLKPISDAELVRLSSSSFDKSAKIGKRERLGSNHGATVVAEYPCSDVCPDYTMRVIHYDVVPGAACARVGGVIAHISIPMGIGVGRKDYCIPAAIAKTIAAAKFQ